MYYDTLNGCYVDFKTLQKEFDYLVKNNQVDTTSFNLYFSDLLRSGNLELVEHYTSIL